MPESLYVYILSNGFRKLYIGVTNNLERRLAEHKAKLSPDSHTARYKIDQLVYFERFQSIAAAINREKQLKGWLRIRKLQLIIATNPAWHDLSKDWRSASQAFGTAHDQSQDRAPQHLPKLLSPNAPLPTSPRSTPAIVDRHTTAPSGPDDTVRTFRRVN